jgi:hypothetical protein
MTPSDQNERHPSGRPEGLELAYVPVPPDLAKTFGYEGDARYVAFYWSPAGDEVMYDDGRSSGTGEWHAFAVYRDHRNVAPELRTCNLGHSDGEADQWLIVDQTQNQAYVAPVALAPRLLIDQHPPLPVGSPEDAQDLAEELRSLFREGLEEIQANVSMDEIHRMMEDQREPTERMLRYLDAWPDGTADP